MWQGEAAEALSVSQSALSNYENGRNAIPIEILVSMARLYRRTLADIVSEEDGG